jgi:hypothetical protein
MSRGVALASRPAPEDLVTRIHHGIVAVGCLVAGLLAGSVVPLMAAGTPAAVDEHPVGRHMLVDDREFPGADCRSHTNSLVAIRVRRPVMYAHSRTNGVDHQTVGWRWQLRSSAFALVAQGPIQKATATDVRPASFSGQVVDMVGRPPDTWFIAIRMYWYKPGSSTRVQGKSLHYVRNYARDGSSLFGLDGGCDLSHLSIFPQPPSGHTGHFGVHVLLDDVHETPAICRYGPGSAGLISIKVRQPIVFASDSGPGIQSQHVRWRFVVEETDDPLPDKNTVWTQLPPGHFVTAGATERKPAGFGARSRSLGSGERGHAYYRVKVSLRWLRSNGTVAGAVVETAARYALVQSDGSTAGVTSLCFGPPLT